MPPIAPLESPEWVEWNEAGGDADADDVEEVDDEETIPIVLVVEMDKPVEVGGGRPEVKVEAEAKSFAGAAMFTRPSLASMSRRSNT
jgi:hypothetical protein